MPMVTRERLEHSYIYMIPCSRYVMFLTSRTSLMERKNSTEWNTVIR